jgi:hypothetical protein
MKGCEMKNLVNNIDSSAFGLPIHVLFWLTLGTFFPSVFFAFYAAK